MDEATIIIHLPPDMGDAYEPLLQAMEKMREEAARIPGVRIEVQIHMVEAGPFYDADEGGQE